MPPGRPKGSKNNSTLKGTKKQPAKSTKLKEVIAETFPCSSCGHVYDIQKGKFYKSPSPMFASNNGYITVCNKCISKYEEQFTEIFNDNDIAAERLCQIFGWYVNESILQQTRRVSSTQPRIGGIISKSQINPYTGKVYDDRILERNKNVITSMEELQEAQKSQDINVTERTVKAWGFGFSPEDYEFLNMQFSDWKARVVVDSKTRESLVKELCVLKLQMDKAIQNDSIELYNKLMSTYTSTLDKASLLPKQEEAADKSGEKPIGVMIEMFENERPIPPPEEEWLNSSMFKLITVYFIGHLCKMLGIKNKYSQMYENEMDKYRVEVPELDNAEDDDIFDYLVNDKSESETDTGIGEILNG